MDIFGHELFRPDVLLGCSVPIGHELFRPDLLLCCAVLIGHALFRPDVLLWCCTVHNCTDILNTGPVVRSE